MQEYFHSVTLNRDKCTGCTNCIKRCPTEAIRVRDGKARIIKERCIDCGECIRVCPHHAKTAVTDPLEAKNAYRYSIAMPAPTLYGQFKNVTDISYILGAIKKLGFDDVFETSVGADIVSEYTRKMIQKERRRRPLISSACPAVVRLIQVRFPAFTDNIVNLRPPVEVAAMLARQRFVKRAGCKPEDVGVFFISPCPAKMTASRNPLGNDTSPISGVISIMDVYGRLSAMLQKPGEINPVIPDGLARGVGWAVSGGECEEVGLDHHLAVDGIFNVIKALEEIENGRLNDLDFFEGLACNGGCVGGALTFENSYVAKMRLNGLVEKMLKREEMFAKKTPVLENEQDIYFSREIPPNMVMKLDSDIKSAILKMERIEQIQKQLPGLDCGSCGAPSCRCMAEDIVRGFADEMDCIFRLKEKVRYLAQGMVDLADSLDKNHSGDNK